MRAVDTMMSEIGILLVFGMLMLFAATRGADLMDLYDRGPGYVATNIVLTFESVASAPESTTVVYDFEHSEDVQSLFLKSGCDANELCKVSVSRYGSCEKFFRLGFEVLESVGRGIASGTERVGRCIISLGRSCEKKESNTASHAKAIFEQMQSKWYRQSRGISYEISESKKASVGSYCDQIKSAFNDGINSGEFYIQPKEVQVSKIPNKVVISVVD
jgi:hypothetical protein